MHTLFTFFSSKEKNLLLSLFLGLTPLGVSGAEKDLFSKAKKEFKDKLEDFQKSIHFIESIYNRETQKVKIKTQENTNHYSPYILFPFQDSENKYSKFKYTCEKLTSDSTIYCINDQSKSKSNFQFFMDLHDYNIWPISKLLPCVPR